MLDFTNWLMVFLRVERDVRDFPRFLGFKFSRSIAIGPRRAALDADLSESASDNDRLAGHRGGWLGRMALEIGIGLTLGFVSRMVFYALDLVGGDHQHGDRLAAAHRHQSDEWQPNQLGWDNLILPRCDDLVEPGHASLDD